MTALSDLEWYQVDVRAHTKFQCDECGVVGIGDRIQYAPGVVVSFDGRTLGAHLSRIRGSSAHMPVGWSSHYHPAADRHKCPNCNKENS